tara:strand:- start:1975 stop:2655 length:681 start_codon:yes stop_codon:yes gene_type:complete
MANISAYENIEGQKTAGIISAGIGVIPVVAAAICFESALAFASTMVTLSGLFHSSLGTTVEATRAAVEVADSIVAVTFTLIVCVRIGAYRTLVGALRLLWIVAIVTSSCSYVAIRELAPDNFAFIPNDLTIVALGVACVLLVGSYAVSRCYQLESARDARILVVESMLVVGSFTLRFDEDIARIIRFFVGWVVWYLACHVASLVAVCIVRHPRSVEAVTDVRLPSL